MVVVSDPGGVVVSDLGGSARPWGDLPGLGGVCQVPGGYGIPACTEADTLPPCGQTHTCKNITLAKTSFRPVKMVQSGRYASYWNAFLLNAYYFYKPSLTYS